MKRPLRITVYVLLALLLGVCQARAGEIVVYEFKPGAQMAREVLEHVKVKGLVAELLDPADTGLGKSLGYLLWREVLTAISDQKGAGVILARLPGEKRLTDLLKENYHQAALEIAEQQQARMLLWGAVNAAENTVYLSSYLTLIPEIIGADLALSLDIEGTNLSAANPRTRFNFAPATMERDGLFRRAVVTRAKVQPRREPQDDTPSGPTIAAGTALAALDMQGPWFRVRLPGGGAGYVNQSQVAVPPLRITADDRVNVRTHPGTDSPKRYPIGAGESFPVLDMRYRQGHGTWYRIERNGESGWVASWVVRPHYTIPAIMLVAGLYRYQSKNYDEAVRSFKIFLRNTEAAESNVNRAVAYQLLGAAQLAGKQFEGPRSFDTSTYLAPFNEAVRLTPHDPAARNLRALGSLAGWSLPAAVKDLEKSLELDRFNESSYRLLEDLSRMLDPQNPKVELLQIYDFFQESDVVRLEKIKEKFASSRQLMKSIPRAPPSPPTLIKIRD